MSVTPKSSVMPLVIAAIATCGFGYGLGRWQANMANESVAEARDTAQFEAKTAKDGLKAVDTRIAMLEARRMLHIAAMSADENDTDSAQGLLKQAGSSLKKNGQGQVAQIGQKAHETVLSGSPQQQRKVIEGFARELDNTIPSATSLGVGAGQ